MAPRGSAEYRLVYGIAQRALMLLMDRIPAPEWEEHPEQLGPDQTILQVMFKHEANLEESIDDLARSIRAKRLYRCAAMPLLDLQTIGAFPTACVNIQTSDSAKRIYPGNVSLRVRKTEDDLFCVEYLGAPPRARA